MQGRSYRHISLLFFLSPLLALIGYSQVKIHGKITDAQGEPVEFATVRIAGTAIGTTSGLDGDYSLSCPASDTITIHFSCIGFREETRRLIDASGDVTLNMR
ncbi:MAG: carboxypeptidase-like regulatory domain-containing protein, partial [Duncaniella sp.]|nr:carboxypeptidase-like regulatory domain-containing protein [Duncaniella sp.]